MNTRTTKADVHAAVKIFLKAHGLRAAESYTDAGGYVLDHASEYGGYRLEMIEASTGRDTPFGTRRYPAKQFVQMLGFAAQAAHVAKQDDHQ